MPIEQEPNQPSEEGRGAEQNEEEELITLPDQEEMLARLVAIDDLPHLVKKFYPLLLEQAGQQKYRSGVELMVRLAIDNYTQDLAPAVATAIELMEPDIIEALTKPAEGNVES